MLSRVVRRGGFANPHKTSCHFGALLQGIFSNEPLLAAIAEHGIHEGDEAKDCVLCLLQRTEGDSVNASVVSLEAWHPLLESLGFSIQQQQDSSEVLLRLLSAGMGPLKNALSLSATVTVQDSFHVPAQQRPLGPLRRTFRWCLCAFRETASRRPSRTFSPHANCLKCLRALAAVASIAAIQEPQRGAKP